MPIRVLAPAATVYGYARVSTADQNPARQIHSINEWVKANYGEDIWKALDERGFITVDKVSGVTRGEDRDSLSVILKNISRNDVFIVESLERFGRSFDGDRALRKELRERGVILIFTGMPDMLSTKATPDGTAPINAQADPMEELIETLMSSLAQYERRHIRMRQAEGIARAKERGVYARQKVLTSAQMDDAKAQIEQGVPKAVVARKLGVSRSTLRRYLNGIVTPDK